MASDREKVERLALLSRAKPKFLWSIYGRDYYRYLRRPIAGCSWKLIHRFVAAILPRLSFQVDLVGDGDSTYDKTYFFDDEFGL